MSRSPYYAPVVDSLPWDEVNDATSSSSVPMGDLNGLRSFVRNWLITGQGSQGAKALLDARGGFHRCSGMGTGI